MNCPHHRSSLNYVPELSTPNAQNPKDRFLTYYCASCEALYRFSEFDSIPKVRGVLVMKIANIKRAGYYESNPLARAVKIGASKN